MRPTNVCHLYDLRVPVPRSFPARCRGFHRVDAPRSLGSVRHDRGTGCFTTPETASADRIEHTRFLRPASLARLHALGPRAWAFSSHGARFDRASDTPVAFPSAVECRSAVAVLDELA
jgi:hypothetical protein